jgi:hypothetical protein
MPSDWTADEHRRMAEYRGETCYDQPRREEITLFDTCFLCQHPFTVRMLGTFNPNDTPEIVSYGGCDHAWAYSRGWYTGYALQREFDALVNRMLDQWHRDLYIDELESRSARYDQYGGKDHA